MLNLGIGISPGTSNTLPSGVPNGYLKAVFFDKEGNVQAAESQIKYLQTSVSTWQTLEMTFTASQNGYLQVYVANESDQEVFFDDLEVAHTPTLIAQENHYYPYGMNMVGIEKQGMPHNRFQFNAQTERETAFHLHWDETPFRRYDAQIGRFHGVDALASEYAGITPYQYGFNNPVMFNDPTGLLPDATASFGSPGSTFMDEYFNGQAGGDHLQNNFGEEYSYNWSTGNYVNGIGRAVSSNEAIGWAKSIAAQSMQLYSVIRSSYPAVLAALRKAVTTPTDEGGKGSEGQAGLNSDTENSNVKTMHFIVLMREEHQSITGDYETETNLGPINIPIRYTRPIKRGRTRKKGDIWRDVYEEKFEGFRILERRDKLEQARIDVQPVYSTSNHSKVLGDLDVAFTLVSNPVTQAKGVTTNTSVTITPGNTVGGGTSSTTTHTINQGSGQAVFRFTSKITEERVSGKNRLIDQNIYRRKRFYLEGENLKKLGSIGTKTYYIYYVGTF